MFTVGHVYIWDHGPGLFCCWRTKPTTRRLGGSYRMPFQDCTRKLESQRSPRSSGGAQVEPDDLIVQHT